jgi:hypothetical protein
MDKIKVLNKETALFRLSKEVYVDILSRLSSHARRGGVTFIE